MGCLEFDNQRVNHPLAIFVFPSSHGHKQKAHTINTRNAPFFKSRVLLNAWVRIFSAREVAPARGDNMSPENDRIEADEIRPEYGLRGGRRRQILPAVPGGCERCVA